MTLIPFNYQKLQEGYRAVTRSGLYPTEVHRFETLSNSYKIVSIVDGKQYNFLENGIMCNHIVEHEFDLFLEPPVMVEWWVKDLNGGECKIFYSLEYAQDRVKQEYENNKERPYQGEYAIIQATYHDKKLDSVELVKK